MTQDFRTSRDPWELLAGSRNALDSIAALMTGHPHRTWDTKRLATVERQLSYVQTMLGRLRLVLTILPPFDSEEDWAYAEEGYTKADREARRIRNRKVIPQ